MQHSLSPPIAVSLDVSSSRILLFNGEIHVSPGLFHIYIIRRVAFFGFFLGRFNRWRKHWTCDIPKLTGADIPPIGFVLDVTMGVKAMENTSGARHT